MTDINVLTDLLKQKLADKLRSVVVAYNEITIEIDAADVLFVAQQLRDDAELAFESLMDLCGVDYLDYGIDEWTTDKATETTFDRGVDAVQKHRVFPFDKPRFAVVYHLLSYAHNHRVRLKVFLPEDAPFIDSVIDIWPSANWFEREAFDLYGILFNNHPDLRRILTDYGFIGHPFRKDFPLSGTVEVRYDAAQKRVIYEAVDIEPRILTPKVIREDNRYLFEQEKTHE